MESKGDSSRGTFTFTRRQTAEEEQGNTRNQRLEEEEDESDGQPEDDQFDTEIESININFYAGGPRNGPLVLLAHALMANQHMWDKTVVALHKAGYRTHRYDQIGHGESGKPPASAQYDFDDLTRIMRKVRLRNSASHVYAIIGCSMGAVLALRYAMLYPDDVTKVIACDAPGLDALEISRPKWQARIAEFKEKGSEELCQKTVERWFPPPCDEKTKAAALVQTRTCSLEGYEACANAIQTYKYKDELSTRVHAQTMILVGEKDEAVGPPEVLKDVAARIKGSTYVCMKDTGHLPPMHQPKEFHRIILRFLEDWDTYDSSVGKSE